MTTKKSERGRVAPIRRHENRLSSLANRPGPSSQTEMSEKIKQGETFSFLELLMEPKKNKL